MKYLTPIPKQFVNQSGIPYSNGTVSVYLSGNDELADIFEDAEGDALCPNPCTLDSNGAWQCFVTADVPLDYIVKDAEGNVVASYFGVVVFVGGTGDVTKAYVDTQDRALGARISNLDQDLADEVDRAESAEKAAKTEVVEGENIRVEETIAPDGHSIFKVSSDGAPQEQADWNQQDPSEPDYIKNKPTKLSEFTDDITKQALVESGVGIEKPVSSAAVNAGLSGKADKVSNATAGNLAALDANGNLTDSGKKAADFKTKQTAVTDPSADGSGLSFIDSVTQDANGEITPHKKTVQDGTTEQKGVVQLEDSFASTSTTTAATPNAVKAAYDLAATAVQGVKVNGTELSKDGNNVVDVPVPTASTDTPLKDGSASAGSSTQWARGDHRHPTDDSREAVANKVQSIDGSSTTEYPSSKAVADFVNSSVATNTATFLGTISESSLGLDYTATNAQIELALNVHSWTVAPTNNDYCFVSVNDPQTTDVDEYRRFKFNDKTNLWGYEYTLNNSSFTQAQWDAINSGLTSSDRAAYNAAVMLLNTHVGSGDIHVTAAQKTAWTAKYDKPASGIPKTDLASAVQTSLGKADSALQNHQAVSDNNPTLAWNSTSTVGAVGGTDLRVTMPANPASGKLDTNGDGSNVTAAFTAANTRANISTGDKLSVILGKIAKWFADLKSVAWSGSYNDLSEKPNIPAAANNGILTITQNGTSKGTFGANQSSNNTIALTDTTYESKRAASGGTDVSLCTTGEKYTWDGKQNALPTTGTASTTYAIGISGNASTASTADKVKNGSNREKTDNAAPQGLRVDRAYNNGWPYTYGNVITVGGAGDGQLMLGWSGTTGGVAPIYYRNRRDQGGTTWSPWRTIAYQEDNGVSLSGQTLSVKINGTTQSLTNTDNTVKATAKTDNVNYKILATASASPTSGGLTEAVYDTDITLNPSTNTIAANISGRAALATTASKVSATGSQKALAVSVDGISHTNGSKSTVIDGGQVSTDTLSAETAVNSDGFWAKTSMLVYGGDTPDSPTGNYILMSPNGIACYGAASFTGSLVGNASTATAVKDYGNTSKTIEIGWTGDSLTSANFLAAYAVVDGHTYIKDISTSNVTVGRATSDGSGNNIVNTYQKKVMISACARGYSPTINSGSTASVGNRPNNQLGIALLYPLSGTSYIEVSFNLSFTYPSAGGYGTYAVILKAGNSSSSMNQIGSVIKSTYQSGSSNYAELVTVGGSVSSSPSYLVLEITNGYGSSVTFNLSTILIRITQNVTAAAQAT